MSVQGQNRKSSMRAYDFRFAPESGLRSDIARGPFRAKPGSRLPFYCQASNARSRRSCPTLREIDVITPVAQAAERCKVCKRGHQLRPTLVKYDPKDCKLCGGGPVEITSRAPDFQQFPNRQGCPPSQTE